jgi:hypothetical protein
MTRGGRSSADPVSRAATAALVVELLQWAVDTLSEREAAILEMLYGLRDGRPKSDEEVGRIYGVDWLQICRIEDKAVQRLREQPGLEDLMADGLPAAVVAHARARLTGLHSGQRPLIRCPRHGYKDPDLVPEPRYWEKDAPPSFCDMCPCPIPPRYGRGPQAHHCKPECRQAFYRWRQAHPRSALTSAQIEHAVRLHGEGATIGQLVQCFNVAASTIRRHFT